jgi:hypothetical protein
VDCRPSPIPWRTARPRRKRSSARPRSNRWVRPLADPWPFWSLSDGNREALRGLSQETGAIGAVGKRQFEPRRREVDKGAQLQQQPPSAGIDETDGPRRPTMASPMPTTKYVATGRSRSIIAEPRAFVRRFCPTSPLIFRVWRRRGLSPQSRRDGWSTSRESCRPRIVPGRRLRSRGSSLSDQG